MSEKITNSLNKDINLLCQASDNLTKSAISSGGKLLDKNGKIIETKVALSALSRIAASLEKNAPIDPNSLKKITKVQQYLNMHIQNRQSGSIVSKYQSFWIMNWLHSNKLKKYEERLASINSVFEKNISPNFNTESSSLVFIEGKELVIKNSSTEQKLPNEKSQKQLTSDWSRREKSKIASIHVQGTKDSSEIDDQKKNLRSLIDTLDQKSKETLIEELKTSSKLSIEDLAKHYGIEDPNDKAAIITAHILPFTLPTTLLTAHIEHGRYLEPIFKDEDVIPTVFLEKNQDTGVTRPVISADLHDIPWQTIADEDLKKANAKPSKPTHKGSYSVICDPIAGKTESTIKITKNRP